MTLVDLRDLLLSITPNTFHYSAKDQTGNYIVWAEEGQGEVEEADDKIYTQEIIGAITYFTQIEFDSVFNTIQEKLNSVNIGWSLESVQYAEEEEYIIYTWTFGITNIINEVS